MTGTLAEPTIIDRPGIYELTDAEYHSDPVPVGSLSSTGARGLLPPGCPAQFAYDRDHPEDHKNAYDIGHAVHKLKLGAGADLVEVKADNYLTNLAKEAKKAAYVDGKVPLLSHEMRMAEAMVKAIDSQPHAARQFDPDGLPEQSLFWIDDETGTWCRARPDWLTPHQITDLKTSTSADLAHITRQVMNFGYYQQAAWYLDGALALDLIDPDAPFVFVVVSKAAPHLATPIELDEPSLEAGRARNRQALEIFRDCSQSGFWPGHSTDVELVSLPPWRIRRDLEGDF